MLYPDTKIEVMRARYYMLKGENEKIAPHPKKLEE